MPDYSALIARPQAQAAPDYSALTRPSPSVGEDIVKSAATGLQRGMTGLLGLPGDVRSLAAQGFEKATGIELPNMPSWMPSQIGGLPTGARTSAQLQAGLEGAGMPVHEPQTTAGEFAQTVGEFAKQMASLAYDRAEKAGLVVKPQSFSTMVRGTLSKAMDEGIDPTIHSKAFAAGRRLEQAAASNQPLTLKQFDTLRRVVRGAAKSTEADERRIANIMIDRMDDYLDGLKAKDIAAGDLKMAASSIKEARSLWKRMRKSELIDDALERAGVRAGQFSVAGKENAIRTEFRQYSMKMTRDKRFRNLFTPEEQKLIRQLGNMGSTVNVLRTIGKLMPRSALSLGGGAAVGYYGDDPAAVGAAWGVGTAAHLAALGLTKRKAGQVSERVRSGGASLIPGAPPAPALPALTGVQAWQQDER